MAQTDNRLIPQFFCLGRRAGNLEAVRSLLQLGAEPEAGSHNTTALTAALALARQTAATGQGTAHAIVALLMRAGADCLRPVELDESLLEQARGDWPTVTHLLGLLEERRAAGQLQLGSGFGAMQLLMGAATYCHAPLVRHAVTALEQHFAEGFEDVAAGGMYEALCRFFYDRDGTAEVPQADRLAALSALLASSLSSQQPGYSGLFGCLLGKVASVPWGAALVPALHAAGVPPTLDALCTAVQQLDVQCLEALLACGCPAVDAGDPNGCHHLRRGILGMTWSNPTFHLLSRAQVSSWGVLRTVEH